MSMVAELEVALGLKGLAAVEGGLGQVDRSLRQVGDTGERSGGVFGKLGGAVGGAVSGMLDGLGKLGLAFFAVEQGAGAIGGALKAAFASSIDFEHHVSGIKAVTHATQAQTDAMKALAREYGRNPHLAGIGSDDALAAMEELGKEGFSPDQITGGAAWSSLLLASAGEMDPTKAAQMMGDFLHVFDLKADQGTRIADAIAGAANASAVDPAQIAFAFQQAGASASTAGWSPEQTLDLIGFLGNRGIRGERAGTETKRFISGLQDTTKQDKAAMQAAGLWVAGTTTYDPESLQKAKDADHDFARRVQEKQIKIGSLERDIAAEQAKRKPNLETIRHKQEEIARLQRAIADDAPKGVKLKTGEAGGHSAFIDDTGNFKSPEEIARILHDKLGGMSPAEQDKLLTKIFGEDAKNMAELLTRFGPQGLAEMTAGRQGITAEGVGATRNDNAQGDLAQLADTWEDLRIGFGETMQPLLRDTVQWANGMVAAAIPVAERFGDILAGLGGTVAPVLDAFRSGDFNAAFGPIITTIERLFGSDVAGRVTLFASNLLRGFQLARDGFLTFRQALSGDWFGGKTEGINGIVRTLGNLGTIGRNAFLALRAGLSGDWGALGAIWQLGIQPALQGLWAVVQPWVAARANDLRTLLIGWGHAAGDWVETTAVPWLQTKLPLWVNALGTWVQAVAAPFVGTSMSRLGQAFGTWVEDSAIPWLLVKLPAWIAALGTWLGTNVQPILDQQLTNLGKWIGEHLLDGTKLAIENNAVALFEKGSLKIGQDIAKLILTGSAQGFVDPQNWLGVAEAMLATNPMTILMRAAMNIGKGIAQGLTLGIVEAMPDWLIKLLGGDPAATRAKAKAIAEGTYKPAAPPAGQPDDYAGPGPNQGSYQGRDGQLHPYAPGAAGGYQIPSGAAPVTNNITIPITVNANGVDAEAVGARVARATYIELRELLGQPIAGPSGATWEGAAGAGFNR